jgi:hypothetical protein
LIKQVSDSESRFKQALEFFKKKIGGADSDGVAIDVDRMIDAIQNRITVVAIHLGDADDPYLIFESLNAKGAPLTQADLIRNYLLLRLHSNDQQKSYEEAWLPMQNLLPGDNLTEFMRQYLMLTGDEVGKSSIYAALKKRLASVADNGVARELDAMKVASSLYAEILGLKESGVPEIAEGLRRLRRWEVATANPFLLKLFELHRQARIGDMEIAECLKTIESFVVRRAICGVPTNQLKRIFLALNKEMPVQGVASWLTETLASGGSGRRWPKNEEFKESLSRYRAYAQPLDRCKFILETIERNYRHKEPAAFSNATIEHVMPQTLSQEWREMLSPAPDEVHERWLDVLGNLTLTGYNSELSNDPFERKRQLLEESHFELNKWIATQESWTASQIKVRTNLLFEQMKEIWRRSEVGLLRRAQVCAKAREQ